MQKLKLLLTRLILCIMLTSTLVPCTAIQMPAASQPAITVSASTKYSKATIKKVQKKLNQYGYSCGTPDGICGKKTASAIRQYQKDQELKVTGTVNASLLQSLNIKPVKDSSSSGSGSSTGSSSAVSSGSNTGSSSNTSERTVYITDTGSKYHRDGCRYLSRSKHAISLSDALAARYDACSVCRP